METRAAFVRFQAEHHAGSNGYRFRFRSTRFFFFFFTVIIMIIWFFFLDGRGNALHGYSVCSTISFLLHHRVRDDPGSYRFTMSRSNKTCGSSILLVACQRDGRKIVQEKKIPFSMDFFWRHFLFLNDGRSREIFPSFSVVSQTFSLDYFNLDSFFLSRGKLIGTCLRNIRWTENLVEVDDEWMGSHYRLVDDLAVHLESSN